MKRERRGVSGVERRSMRSGEAMVGGMMAGSKALEKRDCTTDEDVSSTLNCFKIEVLIVCAAERKSTCMVMLTLRTKLEC